MAVRWTRLFVPFVFFLFLLSAVFPGAAGARVIHVPAGVPTLELAAGIATADDTVIVTDPAFREKAARFEGLFNIVFPEVTPGFPAESEGAGAPGPSQAPCVADWIEGLVTDTGGTPLPLINVVAFRAGTAAGTGAQTDAAGHYLICTDPGDYNVVFNFSSLNDYLSEVYDNKGFGCGDMVTVLSVSLSPSTPASSGREPSGAPLRTAHCPWPERWSPCWAGTWASISSPMLRATI